MYTNETTHYSIPLPLGSDLTTPMDYNESMQDVDTALFESKSDSSSALQKANQLQQDLSTTNDNLAGVVDRVTTLEGTSTTQGQAIIQNTQDIADVRADALDMIVAKDEGTAQVATVAIAVGEYFRYNDVLYIATQAIAVGDTIVPNTNCKATNIGTELTEVNRILSVSEPITFTYTNVNANIIDATMVKRSGITFFEKLQCKVNTEIPTAHSEVLFTLTSNLPSTAIRCSFITAQGQTYLGKISANGDVTIDNYTGNAIVINTDLYLSGSIILD